MHTSDWHIGHVLYNYTRNAEFDAFAGALEEIVATHQPDVLAISGDVFDTATPSNAAQRFFSDTLMRLHRACPQMHTVVTAGNHDSPTGHEVFRDAWLANRVHAVGVPPRLESDLDRCIVTVPGKCVVAAMPYAAAHFNFMDTDALTARAAEIAGDALPVVLMAHTTVTDAGGADAVVGNIEARSVQSLGDGFDYCALGHIHRARTFGGGRVRYCGSPLAMGFDEDSVHSVTMVQIDRRGDLPQLRTIGIVPAIPLQTLPCDPDGTPSFGTWPEALAALDAYDPQNLTYLRVNVAQNAPLPPDAEQQVRSRCNRNTLFCHINYRFEAAGDNEGAAHPALSASEFAAIDPGQVARMFFASRGLSFGPEEEQMFEQAVQSALENERK